MSKYRIIWGFEPDNKEFKEWVEKTVKKKVEQYGINKYFEVFITDKPFLSIGYMTSRNNNVPVAVFNLAGVLRGYTKYFSTSDERSIMNGEYDKLRTGRRSVDPEKFSKYSKLFEEIIDEEICHISTFYSSPKIQRAFKILREAILYGKKLKDEEISEISIYFSEVENDYWEKRGKKIDKEEIRSRVTRSLRQHHI